MLSFSRQFKPGANTLSNHGTAPTIDQIFAARKWIEAQAIDDKCSKNHELTTAYDGPIYPGRFTESELIEMEKAGITLDDAIEQIERLHS
jgi:hypothetical protein